MPQPAGAAGSAPLAIVTGATSGFGYAACELLLARGVDVILACRSPSSAAAAAAEMAARAHAGAGSARVMSLDLSDLASVATFAAAVDALGRPLALLILNAGMVSLGGARTLTAQGFEAVVGVNHLGHAALFNALLPRLKASRTRVVAVGSAAHASGKLAVGAPLDAASGLQAYANSKLLNSVWGFEVQRRFAAEGVTCNSVHPGSGLYTGLGLGGGSTLAAALRYTLMPLITPLMWILGKSQTWAEGAAAELAAADAADGGLYFARCVPAAASAAARDPDLAAYVWEETQRLLREAARAHSLPPELALN